MCSEYSGPDIPSGPYLGAAHHQDLQRLSFADGSFDVVMSSDVFEHVPTPYQAHREVFRVLKPGGRHIFTAPFWPWEALDDVRAVEEGGQIIHLKDALYHGDPVRPDQGVLVWVIFGLQMLVELAKFGFRTEVYHLHDPQRGIIDRYSFVFVAQKPPTPIT